MSAIQRERERREQLKAEEEALRLDTVAQAEAERQQFTQRREYAGAENRRFLEELKIPEYLQEIIDEEKLKEAYVLWWLKYPIRHNHFYPEEHLRSSTHFEKVTILGEPLYADDSLRPGKQYPYYPQSKKVETFLTRVSLVWDIGYTETHTAPHIESAGVDNVGNPRTSWVGGGGFPSGYSFKSIDVEGSAEEGLLIVRGYKGIDIKPFNQYRVHSYGATYSGTMFGENRNVIAPIETILFRSQLEQSALLQQTLASVYLDTREDYHRTEIVNGVPWEKFSDLWPFDRTVPEQKRKWRASLS